ncbi:MAG: GAF domain-containing sensor histidine kinase [Patescibacteria group bacterium]
MADQSTSQLQNVTQELYKKNLELVNANKEMTLLQRLYESMAVKLNLEELTQEFIEIIVKQLNFPGGLVTIRQPGKQSLQYLASDFEKKNQDIHKIFHSKQADMHVSLHHDTNLLVKAFHQQKELTTEDPLKVLVPLLSPENAKIIAEKGEFTSAITYPLSFGTHQIAALSIFFRRNVSELSHFEREVLNRVATVFGVALDRVMIYQDLKSANKKLKMLDKLKDEFVSIASHELRTPLTAVKGYLWLALNKSPTPLAKEVETNLKIAHDSTERLSRMVEDMLTISRIEGNRLKLEVEEFDLSELTKQVYDELSIRASTKHIDFTVNLPPTPIHYKGDKEKIRECIINITGNALKFTPEQGKISITLAQVRESITIKIADTGPGISAEDKHKLFQKFSKLDSSYQKVKESGTGLGLYITKQIIDMHGGSITVDSQLGEGTTFGIVLPLKSKLEAQ